jgi:hypothetical protein
MSPFGDIFPEEQDWGRKEESNAGIDNEAERGERPNKTRRGSETAKQ